MTARAKPPCATCEAIRALLLAHGATEAQAADLPKCVERLIALAQDAARRRAMEALVNGDMVKR